MISKLTAQGSNKNKPFKPEIYQGKRGGQTKNYHDQGNYQNRYRSSSGGRRMSFRGRAQYSQNYRVRSQYIITIIEVTLGEELLEECKIIEVRILRGGYRGKYQNKDFGRGRSRPRERQYSSDFRRNYQSSGRSRSGLRASTNIDRIRCFKCREYDHFAKDCPNSGTEKEQSGQIQQMFNLEGKTAFKVLAADTYDDIRTNSDEALDHLKL